LERRKIMGSMTREEASVLLKMMFAFWANTHERTNVEMEMALNLALTALRPISRDRIEKVWSGCHECSGCKLCIWNETKKCNDCKNRNSFRPLSDFCPRCGKPLTDEAVEMVMERWEALNENRD
jgi:hypothetical protein